MSVRKIKGSWWVDLRANHKRFRRRSPDNSKTGASAYEATLRRKIARGESIDDVEPRIEEKETFEQFSPKWFQTYVMPNNKPLEQRAKKYILKSALIPFFGQLIIEQIAARQIEEFKAHCLAQGVSRKTVNNRLAVLSKCLSTAYEWLDLPGAPPKVVWLKCLPHRTDFLSADECEMLLTNSSGTLREMILVALRTGMRHGEITGLQWSSINWQNRIITVRHSWCDRTHTLESPKSNRERHIPMDADVYEVLFKRKNVTGHVFLNKGKPYASHRLIRDLREVRYKVGLRPFAWHTLRHTFASHLAMKGVPLHIVQALLGHSSISTTMRYAHVAPSMLRNAIHMLNSSQALTMDFGHQVGNQWMESQNANRERRLS